MLVISQDKYALMNMNQFVFSSTNQGEIVATKDIIVPVSEIRHRVVAKYSTKEKSLKVLQMIANQYQYICECKYLGVGRTQPEFVFHLPQDSEVEEDA